MEMIMEMIGDPMEISERDGCPLTSSSLEFKAGSNEGRRDRRRSQ